MKKKHCDIIFANDVSKKNIGFNSDYNKVSVIDKKGNSEHSVFAKELIQILKENEEVILASRIYKIIKSRLHLNEQQIKATIV